MTSKANAEWQKMADACAAMRRSSSMSNAERLAEEKVIYTPFSCLICDKQLGDCFEPGEYANYQHVDDGGWMRVDFGFGSRFDLKQNFPESLLADANRVDKLLAATKIIAFICDDCFEVKADKFHAYVVKEEKETKRVL